MRIFEEMERLYEWELVLMLDGVRTRVTQDSRKILDDARIMLNWKNRYDDRTELLEEIWIRLEIKSDRKVELVHFHLDVPQDYKPEDRIFVNGYQSWTESREFAPDEAIPPLKMPFKRLLNTTGDYTFFPHSNKKGYLHSHLFTYVRRGAECVLYADQEPKSGYTVFETRVKEGKMRMHKFNAGERPTEECVLLKVRIRRGLPDVAAQEALAKYRPLSAPAPVSGWTSWYHYYTRIDERIILDNLAAFRNRNTPISIFQIDDGWQVAIGDWLNANEKFPRGMKHLADEIHAAGYQAGLWLAPFIVEQKSWIYQEHPDWLLTYDGEKPVAAGFNPGWGGMFKGTYYVLDLGKEEVKAYLRKVFQTVLGEWGYDVVKLDFLFAMGLIPRGGLSRGQWMHAGMEFLKECIAENGAEKYMLACGVPIAAAAEHAAYCRIGPDIGLTWDMKSARAINLRERISTKNAIGNA
ncbi:MAG: alpha-galactosidase, partial [Bacteroidota bacterium]